MIEEEQIHQTIAKLLEEREILISRKEHLAKRDGMHPVALIWLLQKRLPQVTREQIYSAIHDKTRYHLSGEGEKKVIKPIQS